MMSNILRCCFLWMCFLSSFPVVECQSLRLAGGSTSNSGRLEIYLDGKWGTVQRQMLYGHQVAKVACRELGYSGYSAEVEPVRLAATRVPVWLQYVTCYGHEVSLLNCTHYRMTLRRLRFYSPSHKGDTAILCLNNTKAQIPLRLADGQTPNRGRLEIKLNEEWQTVCFKTFDPAVANVACRNMGYRGDARILASFKERTRSTGIKLGIIKCRGAESFLLDCVRDRVQSYTCPNDTFNIMCTNQTTDTVPMRLVDGETPNSGILEIKLDGSWGTVCRQRFDAKDAKVACRSMGYSEFGALIQATNVNSSFWLYGVNCTGEESHLLECPYSNERQSCGRLNGVEIICTNHTTDDFSVRLSDSITPHSGRLEVRIGGVWGTVCNKHFDIADANVACRDLGYSGADGIGGLVDQDVDLRSVPVWINNVDCTGTETSLSRCSYNQKSIDNCYHEDDVGVRCRSSSKDSFPLRLMDGESPDSGRLEIQVGGVWGTVCKDHFGQNDGTVACRNLGYWKFHRFLELHTTYRANVPVWLDNVGCSGSESHLVECAHNGLGIHNCTHNNDVAIKCLHKNAELKGSQVPSEPLEKQTGIVSARLQNGLKANMGRLEIGIDGVWGTVCLRTFDLRDATVACRMLGYPGAYGIMDRMHKVRSDSVLPIWLENLRCTGSESHLLDCPHRGIGVQDCRHEDDVGLKCLTQDLVSARLMDGLTPNSGRLELEIDGVWGTVCKGGFGKLDATVACRMLGYNGTSLAFALSERQRGPRSPMWLHDLRCNGTESSLLDCPHQIKHPADRRLDERCSRRDDISITCFTSEAT